MKEDSFHFLKSVLNDRIHLAVLVLVVCLFFWAIQLTSNQKIPEVATDSSKLIAHVFFSPTCPHCIDELEFLEALKKRYPKLEVQSHNVHKEDQRKQFFEKAAEFNVALQDLGTPFLIIEDDYLIGFHDEKTTGVKIENWVKETLENTVGTPLTSPNKRHDQKTVTLPVIGELNVYSVSLPLLAITLGFVDGFNPCAMWVLVYLISLIIGLKDRTKIIVLVGTFLAASGILYFLFMTAWLNVFLFMGYIPFLTALIGTFALYMGIMSIKEFIQSGGQLVCKIGDLKSRQKTRSRIQSLIASPLCWGSFLGIVGLAFTVNSIEFICSSALPAIFTHVLSVANLSLLTYYAYILLYVLFFMLDDLIIFTMAIMAAQHFGGEKYAGFCKTLGGGLMMLLGIMLLFFPEVLR